MKTVVLYWEIFVIAHVVYILGLIKNNMAGNTPEESFNEIEILQLKEMSRGDIQILMYKEIKDQGKRLDRIENTLTWHRRIGSWFLGVLGGSLVLWIEYKLFANKDGK